MLSEAQTLFTHQCKKGVFPGGQLVVRAKGETLLNLSIGVARGYRADEGERIPVTE